MLARGSNAMGAVVAASAVMSVVEPMLNAIGCELFAIVYNAKSKQSIGYNASGWLPCELATGCPLGRVA